MKRPIWGNDITVYRQHSDMCGCYFCANRYERGTKEPFFVRQKFEPHEPGYSEAFREAEMDYGLAIQYG